MRYIPSDLEKSISMMYKRMNVYKPNELEEELIARYFRIFLYRKPMGSMSYENGRFVSITIDQRLPVEQQREQFYHELCHILRHCGWQAGLMPKMFRELQEWDAQHFTRYASIPFHMLKYVDFQDPYVVDQMVSMFKVTPELCMERLFHLKRRMSQIVAERRETYGEFSQT